MSDGMEEAEVPAVVPTAAPHLVALDNEEDATLLRSLAERLSQTRRTAETMQRLGDSLTQSSDSTMTVLSPALDALGEAAFDHQVHCLVESIWTLRDLAKVEPVDPTFAAIAAACLERLKSLYAPAAPAA